MNRIIKLNGTFNTRDMGGIVNREGRVVRSNRMYRSDALDKLTQQDVDYFKHKGLNTIVDFRGEKEAEKAPDIIIPGVTYINLSPNAEIANMASGNVVDDKDKIERLMEEAKSEQGRKHLESRLNEMEEQMREIVGGKFANHQYSTFLNLISDERNLPILHHCRGGKDRTGFASIITLLVLDVDIEDIKKDYMLTKECMADRNRKRMSEYRAFTNNTYILDYLSSLMQTKESYFDATIDEMIRLSTSTDLYLKEYLNVTSEKKEKIKSLFLTQ